MQKTILITGASAGIGYDTAIVMRALGWRVFATARSPRDVQRLESEGFESLLLDAADSGSIQAAFAELSEYTADRLDGLFCNAGYGQVAAQWKIFHAVHCAISLKPTYSAYGNVLPKPCGCSAAGAAVGFW